MGAWGARLGGREEGGVGSGEEEAELFDFLRGRLLW